jgi:hypothetical protein
MDRRKLLLGFLAVPIAALAKRVPVAPTADTFCYGGLLDRRACTVSNYQPETIIPRQLANDILGHVRAHKRYAYAIFGSGGLETSQIFKHTLEAAIHPRRPQRGNDRSLYLFSNSHFGPQRFHVLHH